jgi:hypothetical protein
MTPLKGNFMEHGEANAIFPPWRWWKSSVREGKSA